MCLENISRRKIFSRSSNFPLVVISQSCGELLAELLDWESHTCKKEEKNFWKKNFLDTTNFLLDITSNSSREVFARDA